MPTQRTSISNRTQLIGNRYQLLAPLGSGGMGTVYRAFDRLNDEMVALKRLATLPMHKMDSAALRLMLAREFQALARLHHPNIIAVRDYGFANDQQPFFTMDLLPDARTLTKAGEYQSSQGKVGLLVQLLSALVYLYRRQIIHRDIKPGNVLVVGQQVKLLDFGLAAEAEYAVPASGSLAYMAPELFAGATPSSSSDLYAVGVLAFEMFAGWHPFGDLAPKPSLAIERSQPDFTFVDLEAPLIAVLQRLLAQEPTDRYNDAATVITELCAALGLPPPSETTATRESFLQAAPLIGRAEELAVLKNALTQTKDGRGASWLVAGESGIGKTRLVQELRTCALVERVQVLHGRTSGEGDAPYHLWRDGLRHLALLTPLGAQEAAVLQPLVPDIAQLLERGLPTAPPLDPKAAQVRLLATVVDVLKRSAHHQPLLWVLEDLHNSDPNSEELLRWVNRELQQAEDAFPFLLVASYRQDDAPHLDERFPEMQRLHLGRLAAEHIAALSEAMLGAGGRRSSLISFLQMETEGNTFFVVEAMRALAEEAGRLDDIAQMVLPLHVFAGGMRQLVQRRLQRVPAPYQPLLILAAIAGRQLDLTLLQALAPQINIKQWLDACVNASVLELMDSSPRWQFSHDKLRDGLLLDLDDDQRRACHSRIGRMIEQIYADHLAPHYASLAYHYRQANEPAQEQRYTRLAGEQAAAQFANEAALSHLSRGLDLTPVDDHHERYALLLAREQVYHVQGRREAQAQDLQALITLAERLGTDVARATVALRQANLAEATGDYAFAIAKAQAAIALAQAGGHPHLEILGHLRHGVSLWRQGLYPAAQQPLQVALQFARRESDPSLEAESLSNLGTLCRFQGIYTEARRYYEEALAVFRTLGHRRGEAIALLNIGVVCEYENDFQSAKTYYEQSLSLRQTMGDRPGIGVALNNLGVVAHSLCDYTDAITYFEQALAIDREVGSRGGEGYVLHNLGGVFYSLGLYAQAQSYAEQALAVRRATDDRDGESESLALLSVIAFAVGANESALAHARHALTIAGAIHAQPTQAYALNCLGHALAACGQLAEAASAYRSSAELRQALGEHHRAMEAYAGLARSLLGAKNRAQAQMQVDMILTYLQQHSLDGTEEPLWVYWTCYQVLQSTDDLRARQVLQVAHDLLQTRAARIGDETLRYTYLSQVAYHRALIAAWCVMSRE